MLVLRKIVIDLFMAEGPSAKLKKASVTEAAKLQLNRDITNVEFLKVSSSFLVMSVKEYHFLTLL